MAKKEIYTEVDGHRLRLTNLDKVLYPDASVVKAEVIQYYMQVAARMIPFIKNRPLTLIRYPDGIHSTSFYTKNAPSFTPEFIERTNVETDSGSNEQILITQQASLVWIANLAALEIHPMSSKKSALDKPDHFIFDIDPPESVAFENTKVIARQLKDFLSNQNYTPYVKTSGGLGLHVYVPIIPQYDYQEVKDHCKMLANKFIKEINPNCTINVHKEKRKNKFLLDIYRNHRGNSCVAPYSLRGKPKAPVSTPIRWDELDKISTSQAFNLANISKRLSEIEDPWSTFYAERSELRPHPSIKQLPNMERRVPAHHDKPIELPTYNHMLASIGKRIPDEDYLFEIKWDGIRIFIIKNGDQSQLISRNGNDLTDQFPELINNLQALKASHGIYDGEIVCLDKQGKPDFAAVISRMHSSKSHVIDSNIKSKPAFAYLFDIVNREGQDLTRRTIEERQEILKAELTTKDPFRLSDVFADGALLFQVATEAELEGIMAKRKGSFYQVGGRSNDWLKIKVRRVATCFIIGYTPGKGDRADLFGALHLADEDSGQRTYRGKVGTGFDQTKMKEILALLVEHKSAAQWLDAEIEDAAHSTWIKPILQCDIQYASVTRNNTFREPVFIDLIF